MEVRVDEKATVQRVTARMPGDVADALKTLSLATGASVNDIVLRAIRDYLGAKGHRDAVEAFTGKAREQYRVALDKLADL